MQDAVRVTCRDHLPLQATPMELLLEIKGGGLRGLTLKGEVIMTSCGGIRPGENSRRAQAVVTYRVATLLEDNWWVVLCKSIEADGALDGHHTRSQSLLEGGGGDGEWKSLRIRTRMLRVAHVVLFLTFRYSQQNTGLYYEGLKVSIGRLE